jgi:hypothetical protein
VSCVLDERTSCFLDKGGILINNACNNSLLCAPKAKRFSNEICIEKALASFEGLVPRLTPRGYYIKKMNAKSSRSSIRCIILLTKEFAIVESINFLRDHLNAVLLVNIANV